MKHRQNDLMHVLRRSVEPATQRRSSENFLKLPECTVLDVQQMDAVRKWSEFTVCNNVSASIHQSSEWQVTDLSRKFLRYVTAIFSQRGQSTPTEST